MGLVTRKQLLAQGVGRSSISRALQSGKLHRILPSVYSTAKPTYLDRCAAVTLWKPDAVLSHSSAASLWGLLDEDPKLVEATVPPTSRADGSDWVRLYRRNLASHDLCDGLPVVPIEQCFIDVATTLPRSELEAFFDRAIAKRVPWKTVARLCDESPGRHGITAVREQLRTCCPLTHSEPERIVARALTSRNFHLEINARVGPYFGDLVDKKARVIVEIDGREFHSEPEVFNNDRRRQNALVLDGWLVLRYSAATAMAHLDAVADEIITVVRRRRHNRA
ncbi:type IV toxin-antitoxin system AbiEi family antitoxin domain-containing protein [Rhodococcus sp. ARC_M6]|uniref:type IV toxin-antitoxin system AbiEi family antitoxin domain-containing protein n=1 Tax=Rhodococcus sp. ARC_M6 TaxID=2928852 RepID=UPI001FB27470|nr:type IV toxin-antitoxin system AbiEi family antitoxin domain-containing protein [Rhodococcus sp. ARC_M6]MCJ0902313.1 DUF559 domain-containing protein [Rhodococcus sp. ARC_M6]